MHSTFKEKNAFKKETGITVVQESRRELGGHCGCDFTHILHHWEPEFYELYQTQGHHQLFSKQYLLAATSCHLMVTSSPLVTMPPFQTPTNSFFFSNQFLLLNSTLASCTLTSCSCLLLKRASLVAQLVKNLLAMREIPVQFLGWEDLLEKG